MNRRTQSIALAIGGFIGIVYGMIKSVDVFSFIYPMLCCFVGFWNWIELENKFIFSNKEVKK